MVTVFSISVKEIVLKKFFTYAWSRKFVRQRENCESQVNDSQYFQCWSQLCGIYRRCSKFLTQVSNCGVIYRRSKFVPYKYNTQSLSYGMLGLLYRARSVCQEADLKAYTVWTICCSNDQRTAHIVSCRKICVDGKIGSWFFTLHCESKKTRPLLLLL